MAKQSALHHWAARAGAAFTELYGWQTPARFSHAVEEAMQVRKSAGLADVSWTSKFDLKGRGMMVVGVRSWTLGPRHLLLTGNPGAPPGAAGMKVTEVTSVYAQFLLAGPRSREILAKLTSLNVSERAFPEGECRQTNLAHVHSTLLRSDLGGMPGFHVLVSRDYGESVWEALLHAGQEFGAAPFGLEALGILEGG